MSSFLLAIDQGTTGTTALVVGSDGKTRGRSGVEFPQHFPKPGWVEHDAGDIWDSVGKAVTGALAAAALEPSDIAAIGITNQRETTVLWDRKTLEPIHRAIVWQCRRTAPECERRKPQETMVRKRTGLVIDAYFSATKIAWILDAVSGARARAERGELAFGTIDSFLVSKLTAGKVHVTDATNASRTLLMDIHEGSFSGELCELFRVPMAVLPRIVPSAGEVGRTKGVRFLPDGIPICGIAGDQQAALFGQACFAEGDAKCTYGTGAFALMNIGKTPILSRHGLVTTIAWRIGNETTYALEGSAFIAGAAVQWLRDGLGIIAKAAEIEALARSVPSSDGVVFVPALSGLGAPYWDQDARGTLTGLTRGTTKAHLARATLEGIAFEVYDLLEAMAADAGRPLGTLRVDGGAAQNSLLLQFQADIARVRVERPVDVESTGRGAAMLAAVGAGIVPWSEGGSGAARAMLAVDARFEAEMPDAARATHLADWREAVARTRSVTRRDA